MTYTQEAIDLIKSFEGLKLEAYKDPVGVVTIGYGYTNRAGFGPGVQMGDKWTAEQAEQMLALSLQRFAAEIRPLFKQIPNPNQFGAFLSLAYNIGTTAFGKSTALKRWNAGDMEGCAEAMLWFNKAGGKVMRGLVRRREAEVALFMQGHQEPAVAAPDVPRSSVAQSSTMQASAVQIASGAGAGVAAVGALDGTAQIVALIFAGIVILAAAWVMRERIKKWAGGDQ